MALDQAGEIGNFVGVIGERIKLRTILEQELGALVGGVVERKVVLHPKFASFR